QVYTTALQPDFTNRPVEQTERNLTASVVYISSGPFLVTGCGWVYTTNCSSLGDNLGQPINLLVESIGPRNDLTAVCPYGSTIDCDCGVGGVDAHNLTPLSKQCTISRIQDVNVHINFEVLRAVYRYG